MSLVFNSAFLPAASINQAFAQYLTVSGGQAPYSFALVGGSMPAGLVLNNQGLISGTATTLGLYSITIEASDSTAGTPLTVTQTFSFQVLDLINLIDSTVDQAQFVAQFEADLATTQTWSTGLTTQTSQTLIEFVSAIGTFLTSRIARGVEDAFPETAQSDSSIRAIVNMQGLRLSRKLPAAVPSTLTSTVTQTLPPFAQLSGGGYNWFLPQAVTLQAGVPQTVILREGLVVVTTLNGLGSDLQTWVSVDDQFTVSDQDVVVSLNGADLTKAFGALWNYPGQGAYADSTLSDGRLNIQFGAQGYGTVPGVNDVVVITYAKTLGFTVNGANLTGVSVSGSSVTNVSGSFTGNPSGAADERSTFAYKNFAAGSFGTYSSAVTKSQYAATVTNYPGVVDAITQAQREINPGALQWMNVIRIALLTSSTWSPQQQSAYIAYLQSVCMYQPRFLLVTPIPVVTNVDVSVYCFNSVNSLSSVQAAVEAAITALFSIRPGILMVDFFPSDIEDTIKNAAPGQISYSVINSPTDPQAMVVTNDLNPDLSYSVTINSPATGGLSPAIYDYAVTGNRVLTDSNYQGQIDASFTGLNSPPFPTATAAGQWWIITGSGRLGFTQGSIQGVTANAGDQLVATGPGSSSSNFTFNRYGSNSVVSIGNPVNWVTPQVVSNYSQVNLFWTPVSDAVFFTIWGRRPGYIGVVGTVANYVLTYSDFNPVDPSVVISTATLDTPIKYNSLGTLNVSVAYASRQSSASLPIRDSTS